MTDQQYTPTETTVRYWYIYARRASAEFNLEQVPDTSEAWAEFDRWLAERDARIEAAAEQRGAVKALREARSEWFQYADAINDTPSKYYPALWLKNRADQMEGDVANQGDWCHAEHCPYRGTGKMPTHRRHEHCPVWRTNA